MRAEMVLKQSPIWKKNDDRSACAKCQTAFTFFNRRHHCRGCGDIFCNSCSGLDVDRAHRGFNSPQRVCVLCAAQKHAILITQTQAGISERLLVLGNYEAAIQAAEVGMRANYEEDVIVDPVAQ